MGWIVGLEPTTSRATIWHSSQLNYIHHVRSIRIVHPRGVSLGDAPLARLQGFEPGTYGLEGRCSILLSYRRIAVPNSYFSRRFGICQCFFQEIICRSTFYIFCRCRRGTDRFCRPSAVRRTLFPRGTALSVLCAVPPCGRLPIRADHTASLLLRCAY